MTYSLLLEIAAYGVVAHWLHWLYGWSYAFLAAGAIAVALLNRLLMVFVTSAIAHRSRSPREPAHGIGAPAALAMLLREWGAVARAQLLLFPFERMALRPDPPPAPSRALPVVLVHGYYSNRGYFRSLVRSLEARGVHPVFTPNFPGTFADIGAFAEALHREIERVCAGTGSEQLALVCHSMGGLAAREYLCRHGAGRVRKLVTIATPHRGTLHARLGQGANAREMRLGSAFLGALAGREGERGPACGVTSIYTPHDNLVAPQDSSVLPWARNIALPGRGHVEILSAQALAVLVAAELRECGAAGA
ncbi:MAG TPA: alpha/beta fold hydrolase [Usitatibacter sp.]|nr:alpha/beta fold hydrolase [Usitatibacter sp.]